MTTRETYSISVGGLTAALAELVKQIRTQDPSVGTIRCKLYDGSAVTIVIGEGPVGAENEAWRKSGNVGAARKGGA
jgi:hypothetical protein